MSRPPLEGRIGRLAEHECTDRPTVSSNRARSDSISLQPAHFLHRPKIAEAEDEESTLGGDLGALMGALRPWPRLNPPWLATAVLDGPATCPS